MNIPLPLQITNHIEKKSPNLSLYYYKYTGIYEHRKDNNNNIIEKFTGISRSEKENFLKDIVSLSKKNAYQEAFQTRHKYLSKIGICVSFTTSSRLIIGSGYDHPIENGFSFDWTTGLPIIPGSSIKGSALTAAKLILKGDIIIPGFSLCGNDISEIFGFQKNKDENNNDSSIDEELIDEVDTAGEIIFFSAFPEIENGKPFIDVDEITPHYQPYYMGEDNKIPAPADWFSPVPLHFLTVPEEIQYCFRIAERKSPFKNESELLTKTKIIIEAALTEVGIGSKTGVGYGFFK